MTDIPPIDWQQRLADAETEWLRRRAARSAVRRELDVARQAGLRARHQRKLTRNRRQAMTTTPEPGAAARRLLMTAIVALDETEVVGRPAADDLEAVANADLAELFACGPRTAALDVMHLAVVAVGVASQLTGETRVQIGRWICEFAEQEQQAAGRESPS